MNKKRAAKQPHHKSSWQFRAVELLATGVYLGKIPKAPGTWGTIGAIPLVGLLHNVSPSWYMVISGVSVLAAILVAQLYEKMTASHDASEIVIDEIVGYLLAMLWLPWTWQALFSSFLLFRVLDIWKPFPIGYLDKKIHGGVGVVVDDMVAGLLTNILLQVVYLKTPWLGVQWVS